MQRLANKVAVVTGAASGLGASISVCSFIGIGRILTLWLTLSFRLILMYVSELGYHFDFSIGLPQKVQK